MNIKVELFFEIIIILNTKQRWVSMSVLILLGKVHGSMARAGKVRNQAPKVEKTERARKRQTGRAKKRIQYKRRVLMSDPKDKKKKGPNFGAGKKIVPGAPVAKA